MAIRRNINYINKDFSEYRDQLINYSQTYFPTTYTDFAETSPGMMFIEQAAYVGDVLSFYLDNQIQENFIQYARQSNNLFELAYMFGYKPTVTSLANTDVDFYQIVPSKVSASQYVPDYDYALYVNANTQISTRTGNPTTFTIENPIDFSVSSSDNPTIVSIAQITSGNPSQYLLKKTAKAFSGVINSTSVTFGAPEQFPTTNIVADNIAGILDVVDSDGNIYYEVDYLTQNVIFRTIANRDEGTRDLTPEILKPMVVPRRFTTEQTSAGMKIQFGAGTEETNAEDRVLDPSSVAVKMYAKPYISDVEMDPSKLLSSDTMGVVPANTLLKITYLTNTKKDVNINANSLTTVSSPRMDFMDVASLDPAVVKSVRKSIESTNSEPITGATTGLNVEDLRRQVQNSFLNQRRAVTIRDYETLGYAMPPKFGALKRIRAIKNPNPRRGNLNMAVISVDSNDHLTTANAKSPG